MSTELTIVEGDPIRLEVSLGPSVLDGNKADVSVSAGGSTWTVGAIRGRTVAPDAPADGYALVWNATASQWEPQAQSGGGGISDGDKGDITVSASGATWTVDNDAITFAKFQNVEEACLIGRESGAGTGDVKVIKLDTQFVWTTLGGKPALSISVPSDATKVDTTRQVATGTGLTGGGNLSADRTISIATSGVTETLIADDAVTYGKLQNVTSDRLLGRDTASSGNAEELTVGGGIEFTGSGGIQTSALTGDVTKTAGGTSTTIATAAVTYAKIQDVTAASRLLGRGSASGSGDVEEISLGSGLSMSGTTLSATATGGGTKTYAVFTPLTNTPPASNFATLDTRNSIPVLEFDGGSTDEYAIWVGVMPEAAVLTSGLEVRITWMADTATSGNVRWGVQFERGNTDLDTDSFDTAAEVNSAANGTSGIPTVASITNTNIDGITAGDLFRLRIYREASDTTNDTMTGDAQLIAVEVRGV